MVQGIGFRKWFQSICEELSIVGTVENVIGNNTVEANILGYKARLNDVFKLVRIGPKGSRIDKIIINYIDVKPINNTVKLEII